MHVTPSDPVPPEGDPSEDAPASRENHVHIYKFNKLSTFCISPLLTLSHPKVIRPKTRRPAGENYAHIYKFNKLSTFCISPLLTLSHPKVIRPKTRRPAGKTKYIFTNLINRRLLHVTPSDHVPPEGDPSEDAPVSRENYVHIYKFNKSSTFCMSTSFRLTIRVLLEPCLRGAFTGTRELPLFKLHFCLTPVKIGHDLIKRTNI